MTGGQMAPTTLEGMPTATCPYGRNIALNGYPLKIGDLLAQLEGTCLVTRQSVQTAAAVRKAKKMLRKAFENAMAGKGTSVVEFVSTCSSGWKMTPEKANKWMVKTIQYHQISFTTNIKGTYIVKKYKRRKEVYKIKPKQLRKWQ